MGNDRSRLREIVEEALLRDEGERSAYLAEVCDDDGGLRSRAKALLQAAEQEDGFLDPPGVRAAAAPGASIGAYRILGALGSDGMGMVYEAERSEPTCGA